MMLATRRGEGDGWPGVPASGLIDYTVLAAAVAVVAPLFVAPAVRRAAVRRTRCSSHALFVVRTVRRAQCSSRALLVSCVLSMPGAFVRTGISRLEAVTSPTCLRDDQCGNRLDGIPRRESRYESSVR